MNEPDLLPGLRLELVDAARRHQRQRTPRRVLTRVGFALAVAAAVVVGVVVADVITATTPAEAGVEITIVDGRFRVLVTDIETRPEAVQTALRDAGIRATVRAVPVGPSQVGRFVAVPSTLPPDLQPVDHEGETFPGFLIPVDFDQPIELQFGGPARRGEQYAVASDAYAAGEPLSCLDVYGARVADIPALVASDDVHVRIQPFLDGAAAGPPIDLEAAVEQHPELRPVDALATSATDVLVFATADGESPFVNALSPDDGACQEGT